MPDPAPQAEPDITDRKVSIGQLWKAIAAVATAVGMIVAGWNYVAAQEREKVRLESRIEALEMREEGIGKLWKAASQTKDALNDDRAAAGKPLLKWELGD